MIFVLGDGGCISAGVDPAAAWETRSLAEFAVIYRWKVDPGYETYFRERWRRGTERLKEFGSRGSCLTRADNGEFIAFARWPSAAARDQAFEAIGPFEPWPGILEFEETRLTVEDDLLTR